MALPFKPNDIVTLKMRYGACPAGAIGVVEYIKESSSPDVEPEAYLVTVHLPYFKHITCYNYRLENNGELECP